MFSVDGVSGSADSLGDAIALSHSLAVHSVSVCLCTLRLPLSHLLPDRGWEARLFLGS